MPTIEKRAAARRNRPAPPAFQPPSAPSRRDHSASVMQHVGKQKATEPGRPTHHKGVKIVEEKEIPSPLPRAGAFRYSRLMLADGTEAYACRDCTETADAKGEIMAHRNEAHGARYGKKPPKVEFTKDENLLDFVLPQRDDGTAAPLVPLDMTLHEILSVAPSMLAMMNLLDDKEREIEQLHEEVKKTRVSKADQHKIDVYDSHFTEIAELRATLAQRANYEEVKTELYALRNWKRKMTTRMSQMGFVLSEED